MIAVNDNYLIIEDAGHKSRYTLEGGTELIIPKDFENNLAERNSQIGWVAAVNKDNKLGLKVNDRIFVLHFTFQGSVGEVKKSWVTPQGKVFNVRAGNIFLKLEEDTFESAQPLGEYLLVEQLSYTESLLSIEFKKHKDRVKILKVSDQYKGKAQPGDNVLTTINACYPIILNKELRHRIAESRIVAIINEFPEPQSSFLMVEPLPKPESPIYGQISEEVNTGIVRAIGPDSLLGLEIGDKIAYSGGFLNKMEYEGVNYTFITENNYYGQIE